MMKLVHKQQLLKEYLILKGWSASFGIVCISVATLKKLTIDEKYYFMGDKILSYQHGFEFSSFWKSKNWNSKYLRIPSDPNCVYINGIRSELLTLKPKNTKL